MCGIVGVVAHDNAAACILEGLRRLEYRGYDSAGIAVIGADGAVSRQRAVGKIANLADRLAASPLSGSTGIGHTRWATHGAPTEANAHPHRAGRVTLVHNGIIENYKSLREELQAEGREFLSDTDTEVVAHYLDSALGRLGDPKQALLDILSRLEGAFALAAMIDGEDAVIVGARRGAPLVAAASQTSRFLASDIMAISDQADTVTYLADGDAILIRPGLTEIFDADGTALVRPDNPVAASAVLVEKGNHRHFMQKEIYEQPEVVARTLTSYVDVVTGRVRPLSGVDFSRANRVLIVGCGTASYAGSVSEYWFERLSGLPVKVDIASEFRYRQPALVDGDIALFISQSGETADTLEALRLCKQMGVPTIALVNTPHSTMAREADMVVPTVAGPEIGVASTKAFTCQMAALAALAVLAGVQRDRISEAEQAGHVRDLLALPGLMSSAMAIDTMVEDLAHNLSKASIVLYLGRNEFYPLALEGALKLKEISYIHAEGYAAGELKHGPIALIEEGVEVVVIAPFDDLFSKTRSSIQEVNARGARVIAITDERGAAELSDEVDSTILIPAAPGLGASLVAAVAVQLIAYYVAVHKGTDVDQPRNLAKSVTVE